MTKTNELTQQILNYLFLHGVYAWRANSTGIFDAASGKWRASAKKGVSDILGCYRGKFIAIEIKTGKDKLRPEQIGFLKSIDDHGGVAMVVKEFNEFKDIWESLSSRL